MIASATRKAPQRGRRRSTAARPSLSQQTEQLLAYEIAFIPNASFARLRTSPAEIEALLEQQPSESPGRLKMPALLEQMCSVPLLTPDRERALFKMLNFVKFKANTIRVTLDARRPNARKLARINQLLSTADRIRNHIVHANIRLAISIVKSFSDSESRFDDLLSEAIQCLLNAVEKFDYDRGFRFSTYATRAVQRDVLRLVQRQHRDRLRFATGTDKFLAGRCWQNEFAYRTETTLIKINSALAKMMEFLDERERFIVSARYGFVDIGKKPTFERLGRALGISKERVRQLEMRAIGKLRRLVPEFQLEPLD